MPRTVSFMWVNKDSRSQSLSHSDDQERIELLSHAQRTSRPRKNPRKGSKKTRFSQGDKDIKGARGSVSSGSDTDDTPITPPPLPYTDWDSREKRSVDFFIRKTVGKIIFLHNDREFWTETVPCLALQTPAFRHLVVSIATTHELLLHSDTVSLDVFALVQCNKATQLLQAAHDWEPALLLVSCILVVAFSLLRCDYAQADLGIESGLKIPLRNMNACNLREQGVAYKEMLLRLGKTNGFKLWSPEISHQFEKATPASRIDIETDHVKGPFNSTLDVFEAYKSLGVGLVGKLMRNLARGAYLDPQSPLAQDAIRQLAMFTYHWEALYHQLPPEASQQRLEMKQLRFGLDNFYLLLFTKIISPKEKSFDAYPFICTHSLELAEELLIALREGQTLIYMDRVVNGGLVSMGQCTRDPAYWKRVVAILKAQLCTTDGVHHWARGVFVELVAEAQNELLGPDWDPQGLLPAKRAILTDLSCSGTTARMDYVAVDRDGETACSVEREIEWSTAFEAGVTSHTVHDSLQGIMAAYRMFGKPKPSDAPNGCVRQIYYKGKPVRVCWDDAWQPDSEG